MCDGMEVCSRGLGWEASWTRLGGSQHGLGWEADSTMPQNKPEKGKGLLGDKGQGKPRQILRGILGEIAYTHSPKEEKMHGGWCTGRVVERQGANVQ